MKPAKNFQTHVALALVLVACEDGEQKEVGRRVSGSQQRLQRQWKSPSQFTHQITKLHDLLAYRQTHTHTHTYIIDLNTNPHKAFRIP